MCVQFGCLGHQIHFHFSACTFTCEVYSLKRFQGAWQKNSGTFIAKFLMMLLSNTDVPWQLFQCSLTRRGCSTDVNRLSAIHNAKLQGLPWLYRHHAPLKNLNTADCKYQCLAMMSFLSMSMPAMPPNCGAWAFYGFIWGAHWQVWPCKTESLAPQKIGRMKCA